MSKRAAGSARTGVAKKPKFDLEPPYITSSLNESTAVPQPEPLTGHRLNFYRELLQSADRIPTFNLSKSGEAEKRLETMAAIGLVTVMDEQRLRETLACDGCNKGGKNKAVPRPPQTIQAQKIVKEWYGSRCIFTGMGEPVESAHIFPSSIDRNENGRKGFLSTLRFFWPSEHVDKLQAVLRDPNHEAINILVITVDAHKLWDAKRWIVVPMGDATDNTSMELEFRWLNHARESKTTVDHILPTEWQIAVPSGTPGVLRPLASGDTVTLRTADPNKYPLPSRQLLTLQANLNIALRASAAAEVTERFFPREPPATGVRTVESERSAEEEDEDEEEEECRTPNFAEFVLQAAVENGSISEEDLPAWRRRFSLPEKVNEEESTGATTPLKNQAPTQERQ